MAVPRVRVLGTDREEAAPAAVLQELVITPLGAGQEVGRSCILMQYAGKTVLVRPAPFCATLPLCTASPFPA